ncbi:Dehydrogenase DhgA [Balamuthia mandrillaris]
MSASTTKVTAATAVLVKVVTACLFVYALGEYVLGPWTLLLFLPASVLLFFAGRAFLLDRVLDRALPVPRFEPSVPVHEWPKSYAMVTGASYGLGYEFAKLLAADGYDLVLVARSEDKLAEVKEELTARYANIDVKCIAKDLTAENAAFELFDKIRAENILVELLINNAGIGTHGEFQLTPLSQVKKTIELNVVALTELTHFFLNRMLHPSEHGFGRGKILNIASSAGFQPGPYMSVYYATKAFVISFTEALSYELRNTDVSVACACPGPITTEFTKTAGNGETMLFKSPGVLAPEEAAGIMYRQWMREGETVIVPGFLYNFLSYLGPFFPSPLRLFIIARLNQQ